MIIVNPHEIPFSGFQNFKRIRIVPEDDSNYTESHEESSKVRDSEGPNIYGTLSEHAMSIDSVDSEDKYKFWSSSIFA